MRDDIARIDAAMQLILDQHLGTVTNRATRAWVQAWRDVAAEYVAAVHGMVADGNVDGALPLHPARLQAALDVITPRMEDAIGVTVDAATTGLPTVVKAGADGEHAMIRAQTTATLHRADDEQIQAIVERSRDRITAASWPISQDATAAIRRRLVRGIAVGDNPRLVAEQIINDTENVFNGGLTRAVNIARTEMLDATRYAQYMVDQANKQVLSGWYWYAHLDAKTCPACIAMHGSFHEPEVEGPWDHHSGRCTRVPVTKSWRDLGVNVPDEPLEVTDASDWFDSLTTTDQIQILGPARHQAWRNGDYPISQWVRDRDNPGWRTSIETPPAPRRR